MLTKSLFDYVNPNGYELGEHIQTKGINEPYRINFLRGRKGNKNPYNTWLGKDCLESWRLYFESERGWPSRGEVAALQREKEPLTKNAFILVHLRRLHKLGLLKATGKKTSRSGLGLHELRDLSRSLLEKAKAEGFNTNSAETWMGHRVDKLFYNRIWTLEPEYNSSQYKLAEKYLNFVSAPETIDVEKIVDERIKDRDTIIAALEDRLAKSEKEKPDMDKWFEENIEQIIKKFNEYGVDMKIRNHKRA